MFHPYAFSADGSGVSVYVIDTGVVASHVDFGGRAYAAYDALGGDVSIARLGPSLSSSSLYPKLLCSFVVVHFNNVDLPKIPIRAVHHRRP